MKRIHLMTMATLASVAWATVCAAQNFQLSGWAEIPSEYRHPGPVSGQFTNPAGANGVVPPYQGQPIPGFSGMIPALTPGNFTSLPDNGFGAQGNSADFVLGIYDVTPSFKMAGDGTTSRGPVSVNRFTPFSDPNGLVSADYIANGPVYTRVNYYPAPATQIPVDAAIVNGQWLTGADFDVESVARMDDGSFWVGEEFGPYLLHFNSSGELLDAPVRHPVLRAPQNPQNASLGPPNLPSSRGFEAMSRNGDGSKLYLTTEAPQNRMPELFLDTGFAIALASRRDQHHQRAVELATEVKANSVHLVTTQAVILEIGNSLSKGHHLEHQS